MEGESWVLNQKENTIDRQMGRSLAILSEKNKSILENRHRGKLIF